MDARPLPILLLALATAGCDSLTSPRARPPAAPDRPAIGAGTSAGRFDQERELLGRYAGYFDLVRRPGTVTALVDGEPVRYRALVQEYVVVPSENAAWREHAICGRSARTLLLWREDGARDAAYLSLLGEDFSRPVSVEPAERCPVAPVSATPFPPHATLHDLDDDEAWVGVAGEAEVGPGAVDASPSGCDTVAVWNNILGVRGPCVATVHAVRGRFELARTGAGQLAGRDAPPSPSTSLGASLGAALDRLLGRRREVRILAANVPGLRFTERCPEQEDASPRNGWVCGGSTFRRAVTPPPPRTPPRAAR